MIRGSLHTPILRPVLYRAPAAAHQTTLRAGSKKKASTPERRRVLPHVLFTFADVRDACFRMPMTTLPGNANNPGVREIIICRVKPRALREIYKTILESCSSKEEIINMICMITVENWFKEIEPALRRLREGQKWEEFVEAQQEIINHVFKINPGLKPSQIQIPVEIEARKGIFADLSMTGPTAINKLVDTALAQAKARVIGQDHVFDEITRKVVEARLAPQVRLAQKGPIATYLLLGPPGVGKTELAKALAEFFMGDREKAFMRIDCGEFAEKHHRASLVGSPPGYVGGEIEGRLSVFGTMPEWKVLLGDEVEKGHPEIMDLWLAGLDEGEIRDAKNTLISFRDALVLFTGNIGNDIFLKSLRRKLGFEQARPDEAEVLFANMRETILAEVPEYFRPELLDRIDGTLIFRPLVLADRMLIVPNIWINDVKPVLDALKLRATLSPEAIAWLASLNYNPLRDFGVRNLGRTVKTHALSPITDFLLKGRFKQGDRLIVGVEGTNGDQKIVIEKAT